MTPEVLEEYKELTRRVAIFGWESLGDEVLTRWNELEEVATENERTAAEEYASEKLAETFPVEYLPKKGEWN